MWEERGKEREETRGGGTERREGGENKGEMMRRGEVGQEKGKGRGEEGEKSREGGSQRRGEWRRERGDAGKGGQERRERAERRGNEMKLVWKEGGIRKRMSVLYGSVCTERVHCVCAGSVLRIITWSSGGSSRGCLCGLCGAQRGLTVEPYGHRSDRSELYQHLLHLL